MIQSILRIFQAIRKSFQEKNRQVRQFKQKQQEVYNESLTEVKLNQQLQYIANSMLEDPTIESVRIRFAQEALPFVNEALRVSSLKVTECAEENEYIISVDEELL